MFDGTLAPQHRVFHSGGRGHGGACPPSHDFLRNPPPPIKTDVPYMPPIGHTPTLEKQPLLSLKSEGHFQEMIPRKTTQKIKNCN